MRFQQSGEAIPLKIRSDFHPDYPHPSHLMGDDGEGVDVPLLAADHQALANILNRAAHQVTRHAMRKNQTLTRILEKCQMLPLIPRWAGDLMPSQVPQLTSGAGNIIPGRKLQWKNLLAKELRCRPESSLQLLITSTVHLALLTQLVQTKVGQLENKPSGKSGIG